MALIPNAISIIYRCICSHDEGTHDSVPSSSSHHQWWYFSSIDPLVFLIVVTLVYMNERDSSCRSVDLSFPYPIEIYMWMKISMLYASFIFVQGTIFLNA